MLVRLCHVNDDFAVLAKLRTITGMEDGGRCVFADNRWALNGVAESEIITFVEAIRRSLAVADINLSSTGGCSNAVRLLGEHRQF